MGPGGEDGVARPATYACPSAPAEPGTGLLGVLGPDGKIHNLRTLMPVDQSFLDAVRVRGAPEERMRFTSRCQTSGCSQWTGTRCGVIDRAMQELEVPNTPPLPSFPLAPSAAPAGGSRRTGLQPAAPAPISSPIPGKWTWRRSDPPPRFLGHQA